MFNDAAWNLGDRSYFWVWVARSWGARGWSTLSGLGWGLGWGLARDGASLVEGWEAVDDRDGFQTHADDAF